MEKFKYWAFISYSHQDRAWGDWLHRTLESYRIPNRLVGRQSRDGTVPKRLFPIFRDREELPTSSDLGSSIKRALNESRYLIVICSPRSAVSRWVNEEVKEFKAIGRENRILCLIVDGEPNASDLPNSGLLECFPESVRYRVDSSSIVLDERSEPIAADARDGKDGKASARLKLLAGLLGVGYDELRQREKQKQFWWRVRVAALVASLGTAFATIGFWLLQKQQIEAYIEAGRQEILRDQPLRAAVHLNEAYRQGAKSPTLRFLLAQAMSPLDRQLRLFSGHGSRVLMAAFSPDGSRIVTVSEDKIARIWSSSNGKEAASISGHTHRVNSARFSPDGLRIVTSSDDRTAKIWSVSDGKPIASLEGHASAVVSATFSPDSSRVLTTSLGSSRWRSVDVPSDNTVKIWDASNGKLFVSLQGHGSNVMSAAFSPDGSRIVTGSEDQTAKIWDASSGKLLVSLKGHAGDVNSAIFSPDGSQVVTASPDKTAKLWDARNGRLLVSLDGHTHAVLAATFSPDGKRVVTAGGDRTAKLWDASNGKHLASLEGHLQAVEAAVFSPNGSRVVTASADGSTKLWDASNGKRLTFFEGATTGTIVPTALFSSDGSQIVTAENQTAKIWSLPSDRHLMLLEGHTQDVTFAVFSTDGSKIATSSADGTARIWDALRGKLLASLQGHSNIVWAAAFDPKGSRIVTASEDGKAKIWNAMNGSLLATFDGRFPAPESQTTGPVTQGVAAISSGPVRSAAFSPDGLRIVTSDHKYSKIWEVSSGVIIDHLFTGREVTSSAFSPDGLRVVLTEGKNATIWESGSRPSYQTTGMLAKLFESNTLKYLQGHIDNVTSAAFSPDGSQIVTGSDDRTVKIWSASSGKLLTSFEGHTGAVESVAFSTDGSRIVTASRDKTAKIWDASNGKLLASIEGHRDSVLSANFSPDGSRVVTSSRDLTTMIWDTRLEKRSPDDVNALVKCRVPWRLHGNNLIPVELDSSSCPLSAVH